ncbi:MAG: cyclodeaminase/cyclohydrolase family protein [Anaerolineae bacterium]|nr:cyclodeaminase/cyclohydrolase family protein [Anaerolineae bacterium]
MNDLDIWLDDMANAALPGGVAAGALAGAMGAALITKAGRVSLRRGTPEAAVADMIAAAEEGRRELAHLVQADVNAYRQVLRQRNVATWLAATEVPLQVAEISHRMLGQMDRLCQACWPGVAADLEIGIDLLKASRAAGLRAARENLSYLQSRPEADGLRRRLVALTEEVER